MTSVLSRQFTLRVTDEEFQELAARARQAGTKFTDYARERLREDLRTKSATLDEVALRLEALEHSNRQLVELLQASATMMTQLKRLSGAAVASGALLRDTGTDQSTVVQEKVGNHVKIALAAAASVVQLSDAKYA